MTKSILILSLLTLISCGKKIDQMTNDLSSSLMLSGDLLPKTGGVSGTIKGDNGTPDEPKDDSSLQDAQVILSYDSIEFMSIKTDKDGKYNLLNLPSGSYKFQVKHASFTISPLQDLTVLEGKITKIDVLLKKVAP